MHWQTSSVSTVRETKATTIVGEARLPPQDPNLIFRLVGYFEYRMALEHLDELLRIATPTELRAIEELVEESDEFKVYTNLARRLQTGPSSLAEKGRRENDNFARRGLPWVMALARVELGAMLAGFARHPAPFTAVGPSRYEMDAYRELLVDGASTHYWALANDPQLKEVAGKFPPDGKTLAYIRRLNIARHFQIAASQSGAESFNPIQQTELSSRRRGLDSQTQQFITSLQLYVNMKQVGTGTNTQVKQYMQNCLDEACVTIEISRR